MATELRWCKLTQLGLLRFDGADAQSFLQGQLTNDMDELNEARSHYSGYCTPKGRLLATLLLWQRDCAYHMMLPRELCESVRKRLAMYILRSRVRAAETSAEHILFGLTGAGAASLAATLAGTLPATTHDVTHHDGISVIMLPLQRYLVAAPLSQAARFEADLAAATAETPESFWTALDIEAGIPVVVAATQEQFVPQTVNFDLIGAVSFDKGCYPGQEIVARTHYLGKVKQRMVHAQLTASDAPAAGDKLYSEAFGDQASGMIVSAAATSSHIYDVLAVIQTSSAEKSDVHWKAANGPALIIRALPYPIK